MDNSPEMLATRCPAVRWVAVLLGVLALTAVPRGALACFFYVDADDNPVIDQTAMQVVLRQRDGQTTMIVGAHTEGYVPDLGWIVPVPRYPTIDADTTVSFVALDDATAPTFRTRSAGGGSASAESSGAGCGGDVARGGVYDGPEDFPEVTVWDTREAGPYTVTVLTAGNLDALRTWATDNEFPWLPTTEPDFEHYISEQWFFVAAKVRPNANEPSLVPLALTYASDELVVPVLLSRRDATPNMGLVVWIIADSPAAPRNWAQVAVPEGQIVASEEGGNYQDLVADAVGGVGGGQAFVTEYVQRTTTTATSVYDVPTLEFLGTAGWVTRLYTRVSPEDLDVDPTFVLDDSIAPIAQLHDLTQIEGGVYWGAALRPVMGFAPVGLLLLARLLRRRRF